MRAYSQDLRQQVLRAVDDGKSRAEIIDLFQVSRVTIKRYVKQEPFCRGPFQGGPRRKVQPCKWECKSCWKHIPGRVSKTIASGGKLSMACT